MRNWLWIGLVALSACMDDPREESSEALAVSASVCAGGGTAPWYGLTPDRWYLITAKASGNPLIPAGGSTDNGAQMVLGSRLGGDHEQWRLELGTDGTFVLRNKKSLKLLHVPGGGTTDGTGLVQWAEAGVDHERWTLECTSDGYFVIVNKTSQKVVNIYNGATGPGASIIQWPRSGMENEQWKFEDVALWQGLAPGRWYTITAKASGNPLIPAEGSTDNGAQMVLGSRQGGDHEQWRLELGTDGTFALRNKKSLKLLHVPGGVTTAGTELVQWAEAGVGHERWTLERTSDGYFVIGNKTSQQVVNIYNGATGPGATIIQWFKSGMENEQWNFEGVSP